MSEAVELGTLHDSHCHLDLYAEPTEVARACIAARMHVVAVTNAPSVFRETEALAQGSEYVHPAIGLHPELAVERWRELPLMWEALHRVRFVGEVGLDYATSRKGDKRKQREVFSEVLSRCHDFGGKVLTVHSRRAADDVVDAVGRQFNGSVILHWYSGSLRTLRLAVERGCYSSVNPAMLESSRFPSLLRELPLERLLLESDGPFVEVGGRPAVPTDVKRVVVALASGLETTEDRIAAALRQNFLALLGSTLLHDADDDTSSRSGALWPTDRG